MLKQNHNCWRLLKSNGSLLSASSTVCEFRDSKSFKVFPSQCCFNFEELQRNIRFDDSKRSLTTKPINFRSLCVGDLLVTFLVKSVIWPMVLKCCDKAVLFALFDGSSSSWQKELLNKIRASVAHLPLLSRRCFSI